MACARRVRPPVLERARSERRRGDRALLQHAPRTRAAAPAALARGHRARPLARAATDDGGRPQSPPGVAFHALDRSPRRDRRALALRDALAPRVPRRRTRDARSGVALVRRPPDAPPAVRFCALVRRGRFDPFDGAVADRPFRGKGDRRIPRTRRRTGDVPRGGARARGGLHRRRGGLLEAHRGALLQRQRGRRAPPAHAHRGARRLAQPRHPDVAQPGALARAVGGCR